LKYKALLIDDSKPVSYFNKVVLERSGKFSSIEVASNGLEAIEALDAGYLADIIFLDINMPVMNGFLQRCPDRQNKIN
jgi:CheY-like chemotaxis protein